MRRDPQQKPRLQLLVFTEGQVTEVNYLTHLHREVREFVTVTIDPYHGGPLQLVERAVDAKKKDLKVERKGKGRARDGYWCLFDTDEHPNLDQALDLAAAHDIGVGLSNPCLELWFLLHYADQTAFLTRHEAQKTWAGICGEKGKAVGPKMVSELMERFDDARSRAEALDTKHKLDDSPPASNPSSSVWRLVDRILGPRTGR
jgi:hypothetical protein